VLREAADEVDNPPLVRAVTAVDRAFMAARSEMAAKLRRLAAEAQPTTKPEPADRAADGMELDEEYAIDVDADGCPFARVLFAFPRSVPGEKRIALVHGITTAVDGAEFGAPAAGAGQDGAQPQEEHRG
jgi:hypothetical protein